MAIIYVSDNYDTIQAAVNAASPGDKIIVKYKENGYKEAVSIDKDNLHILADSPEVFLDGTGLCYYTAFQIKSCSNIKIEGFTILHCVKGVQIYNSSNNTISQCDFSASEYGVVIIDGSNTNIISKCAFSDIYYYGVYIDNCNNNTISQCDLTQCNKSGTSDYAPIKLENTNYSDITKNRIWDSYNGIKISNSHNNNLISNQIWNNTGNDFNLENSNNNLISRNLIDIAADSLININSLKNNTISRNMIRVDTSIINILALSCNTFSNNTIEEL